MVNTEGMHKGDGMKLKTKEKYNAYNLQNLVPEKFAKIVNKILSGKLTLIRRISVKAN